MNFVASSFPNWRATFSLDAIDYDLASLRFICLFGESIDRIAADKMQHCRQLNVSQVVLQLDCVPADASESGPEENCS